MTESIFKIRKAEAKDIAVLISLVKELADYEKLTHEMTATEEDFTKYLFGDDAFVEALIAEYNGVNIGFALYFHNFSTFLGKPGLYLEDLYIKPEFRGKGFGKKLIVELAKIAVKRNCGRFEWSVLDWNESALEFYKSLGAELKKEWIINRVSGEALLKLSQK